MDIKRDDLRDIKAAGDAQAAGFAVMAILVIGISAFAALCLMVADRLVGLG